MASFSSCLYEDDILEPITVTEDDVERAFTEYALATAIFDCEMKCATILESASDTFMEEDLGDIMKNGGSAMGDRFKNVGDSIASNGKGLWEDFKTLVSNFWNWVTTTFGDWWKKITDLFKINFKKIIKKVEDTYPDDYRFTWPKPCGWAAEFFKHIKSTTNDLLSLRRSDPLNVKEINKLKKNLDEFVTNYEKNKQKYAESEDPEKDSKLKSRKISKQQLVDHLKDVERAYYEANSSYGGLKKSLNLKDIEAKTNEKQKEVTKAYKDLAKAISKYWKYLAKQIKTFANYALELADEDQAKQKQIDEDVENQEIPVDESFEFSVGGDVNMLFEEYDIYDDDEDDDEVFEEQFDEILDYIFQESSASRQYQKELRKSMRGEKKTDRDIGKIDRDIDKARRPDNRESRKESRQSVRDVKKYIKQILSVYKENKRELDASDCLMILTKFQNLLSDSSLPKNTKLANLEMRFDEAMRLFKMSSKDNDSVKSKKLYSSIRKLLQAFARYVKSVKYDYDFGLSDDELNELYSEAYFDDDIDDDADVVLESFMSDIDDMFMESSSLDKYNRRNNRNVIKSLKQFARNFRRTFKKGAKRGKIDRDDLSDLRSDLKSVYYSIKDDDSYPKNDKYNVFARVITDIIDKGDNFSNSDAEYVYGMYNTALKTCIKYMKSAKKGTAFDDDFDDILD